MLDILIYVALGLTVLIGVILAVASTRVDSFRTARTQRIEAPPAKLFPLINDLRAMNTWNPYALREPSGTNVYRGPASGPGAANEFATSKSGTGNIEILEAVPPSKVVLRLQMIKPFKADNRVEFTLVPHGSATDVTWAMSGKQPLLAKAMTLFIDCDKMVGRDFEEGLRNLKGIAERA